MALPPPRISKKKDKEVKRLEDKKTEKIAAL